MIFYPKIHNLYKKSKDSNKCMQPVFSEKYFSDIRSWNVYEKLNGNTICIKVSDDIEVFGKKKETKIIPEIQQYIISNPKLLSIKKEFYPEVLYLYGEAIGPKIENGSKYSKDNIFVIFDIFYKNHFLPQKAIEEFAKSTDLKYSKLLKTSKLDLSILSNTKELLIKYSKSEWGDFESEGLILKPENNIKDENNKRIMAKLRREDFILV